MSRVAALLRGINVGGHTVKMEALRREFEAMKLGRVETVIASGNVLFDTSSRSLSRLEQTIEAHLATALGYAVPTFLRTLPELRSVIAAQPFRLDRDHAGSVVYVVFLRSPLPDRTAAIETLSTDGELRVRGREVYWLRRQKSESSDAIGVAFGKILGAEHTVRNLNTVERVVARLTEVEAEKK